MSHPENDRCTEQSAIDLLLIRIKSGDNDAFAELVGRYSLVLRRTAYSILRNLEDAEDAVQETFLRVYTRIDTFQGTSAFSTWVTRIAINSCLMHLRQKRTRPASSLEELTDGDASAFLPLKDPAPDPESECINAQQNERLYDAVLRLPPRFRDIAMEQMFAEASIRELAEKSGVSISAAKSRLHRARRMLHRRLTCCSAKGSIKNDESMRAVRIEISTIGGRAMLDGDE